MMSDDEAGLVCAIFLDTTDVRVANDAYNCCFYRANKNNSKFSWFFLVNFWLNSISIFVNFALLTQGYEFGKILASQILVKFVQVYGKKINVNSEYEPFSAKLPEVFRSTTQPMIRARKFLLFLKLSIFCWSSSSWTNVSKPHHVHFFMFIITVVKKQIFCTR